MNYPGLELENFDKAVIWRKYIYFFIKKYINNKDILEVGAGIGSFTRNYEKNAKDVTLTELDNSYFNLLSKQFSNKKIKVVKSLINEINGSFDTILYLNVLEHIEKDVQEINSALEKVKSNGYLIILVPAHNKLYSKFDEAVGHFKRYEMNFFDKLEPKNAKIENLCYLDSIGYFLYFLNKIFFKEETYPSKFKIFLWDKFFTPVSIIFDKLLNYKFGKNIICIIKKN